VPTIAYFLGIAIAMYHRDHNPPHIHVIYAGYEALIAIDDARVLRGKLPPTVMLIVRRWVTMRRDALTEKLGTCATTRDAGTNSGTGRRC
jgi:hypothetical protein